MHRRWRCYVLGFNSAWSNAHESLCRQLIEGADFCIQSPMGLKVGERYSTQVIQQGRDGNPIPKELVCVALEHEGKIAVVESFKRGELS